MAEIVRMPKLGFDMAEGTLVRWIASEGDTVAKGNILAEIETDKATVEVESSFAGVVLRHLIEEGDIVPVNTAIAVIGEKGESGEFQEKVEQIGDIKDDDEATPSEVVEKEIQADEVIKNSDNGNLPYGVRASPLARRIAEDNNIDIREVIGSGPQGRIIKTDVEKLLSLQKKNFIEQRIEKVEKPRYPNEDKRIPLTKLRSIIGKRMVEATSNIPHFFVTYEYEMTALMEIRTRLNAIAENDTKISVNDFIVKGVALALVDFPNLNSTLDEDKGEVIQHGSINMGVAVAIENGLLTVVCQDANLKSIKQISKEVNEMVLRARDGKVRQDDIEGSTFTVSNLGMWGVEQFTAIINPPETAILALGAVKEVPFVSAGQIKSGLWMKATLSVDHRVSDGAEAAKFMQKLASYLEEPLHIIL